MKTLSIRLLEGKKQALQIKGATKEIVDALAKADPTDNNKYVVFFTQLWVSLNGFIDDTDLRSMRELIKAAEKKGFNKDIGSFMTLGELEDALKNTAYAVTRSDKRKGLSGITKGIDYLILKETPDWTAYIPLTHGGSVALASDKIGANKVTGRWCTSFHSCTTWDSYFKRGITLIYIVNYKPSDDWGKIAISIPGKQERGTPTVWDQKDRASAVQDIEIMSVSELKKLINEAQKIGEDIDRPILPPPEWLDVSNTQNMEYMYRHTGTFIWVTGIWKNGTWSDGIWENGFIQSKKASIKDIKES